MKKFVCSRILREWIVEVTEMLRVLIRALIGFEYKKRSATDSLKCWKMLKQKL